KKCRLASTSGKRLRIRHVSVPRQHLATGGSFVKKFAVILSLVALGTGVAMAGPAEDREALMKTFGKSMGELGSYAKGEKAYDAAAVLAVLTTLNGNVQKLDVKTLFPEGVTGEAASSKIWENFS